MYKILFLLGGHDLEMIEIRQILEEHKIDFEDKKLSWGATLSTYEDLLKDAESYTRIYGIELIEDISPPKNYTAIDHHGHRWCEASSLEQIAELLGMELDREQRLIAANDRGHIKAMRAAGASEEEIAKIRQKDREAQGVTQEEEKLARAEAQKAIQRDGLWIVETKLERPTPLADILLMEGKTPLIVYGDSVFTYYGDQVLKLVHHFGDAIDEHNAYYGGNPLGYFGFDKRHLENTDTQKLLDEAVALFREEEPMYSYHIFMFPFTTNAKVSLQNGKQNWQKRSFSFEGDDGATRYNEYTYFYNYVRPVLFAGEEEISTYYEYDGADSGEYAITVRGKTYRLELDGIALRHFENDIGILSLHLKNTRYNSKEDIFAINDFGRRIFPQFLGDGMAEAAKNVLLACKLSLKIGNNEPIVEDFSHFNSAKNLQNTVHKLPSFMEILLQEAYGTQTRFTPIIDDRMYVMCHLMNDDFSMEAAGSYENSKEWYRYIFVDGGDLTCQNDDMLEALNKTATYTRWSGYGTLYGITRYSFMMLTDSSGFSKDILNTHLRTIYFQMATLLLSYRAMILHFSREVTRILNSEENNMRKVEAEELFKDYLYFKNNIYFQEVTAQDQGIELFDMAREQMRLDHYLHELDHDIEELHGFIQMRIETKRNEQGMLLNKLAGVFLPPSLLAGIFGMNIIDFTTGDASVRIGAGLILLSALFGYGFVSIEKKAPKIGMALLLTMLFAFALLCMPLNAPKQADTKTTSNKGEPCQIIR